MALQDDSPILLFINFLSMTFVIDVLFLFKTKYFKDLLIPCLRRLGFSNYYGVDAL